VVTGPRLPRLDQRPFLKLLSEETGELEIGGLLKLWVWLTSGKHTKNYGKSPFFMGKSTINGHFQ
jgi:hypothetical protein